MPPPKYPAYTPDPNFIFPYPLSRAQESVTTHLEETLSALLLTGKKLSHAQQKSLLSWCALTYHCQPHHKVVKDLFTHHRATPLPKHVFDTLPTAVVKTLTIDKILHTLATNRPIVHALLKKPVFRPYLSTYLSKLSLKASKTPPAVLDNLFSVQLTSAQKTFKGSIQHPLGQKLFLQHVPPILTRGQMSISAKRDHFASTTKLLCTQDATYTLLDADPLVECKTLEDRLRYTYTRPYGAAKPQYLALQVELLHLWHTNRSALKELFTNFYGLKNYNLLLRNDHIPVAVTLEKEQAWEEADSSQLAVTLHTLIPLQCKRARTLVTSPLDLEVVINRAKPAYEPWIDALNWAVYVEHITLVENYSLLSGAPVVSNAAIEAMKAKYAVSVNIRV